MDYPFVTVTGWSSHSVTPSNRPSKGHTRSLSSISSIMKSTTATATSTPVAKSVSDSDLPKPTTTISVTDMAADVASLPSTPQTRRLYPSSPQQSQDGDHDLSTLPDPRNRAMTPGLSEGLTSPHHPDLDTEVATLSTKLINAINHQTTLDDSLSATRLELEKSHEKIRELEARIAEQREMLAGDVWVKRKTVEAEKAKLTIRVAEERKAKQDVELQKKKIEQELENLTAALFEEANKMVIQAKEDARAEHEALQRKNDLLKAQLADTEGLLKSQQEQLTELKHVMEQMSTERDDQTVATTIPSSPGFSKLDSSEEDGSQPDILAQSVGIEPPSPSHPTSFTYLLQPVLRTDLAAVNEFKDLIRTSKRLSGQRVASGGQGSAASLMGLGLSAGPAANAGTAPSSASATPANGSPQTPATAASTVSNGSNAATGGIPFPPLKDTKFYKRALVEDIEPTLRLDIAPGLSWLARRNVLSAMTDGSLVVEPVPANGSYSKLTRPEFFPCSLCGEKRRGEEQYLRTHRFRTSESGSAQRYPLCRYCLNRVRSTCDFLGFLRIVKDGHWRADDDDAERAAWEESVRLREQMFWARIGGGVVPSSSAGGHHGGGSATPSIRAVKSPRTSTSTDEQRADDSALETKDLSSEPIKAGAESREEETKEEDVKVDLHVASLDEVKAAKTEEVVDPAPQEEQPLTQPTESETPAEDTTSSRASSQSATTVRLSLSIPESERTEKC